MIDIEELPAVAELTARDLRLHLAHRHDIAVRGWTWGEMVARHGEHHAKTECDHVHRQGERP